MCLIGVENWGLLSIIGFLCSLLVSCSNVDTRSGTYIDMDNVRGWSSDTLAETSICILRGGSARELYVSARCDYRIADSLLTLELSLERWGLQWGIDTITLNLSSMAKGFQAKRPSIYEIKALEPWCITPPIAGIYKIKIRPISPQSPSGVVAIGIH